MGYLTSGNEIVDAMGSINISGNIIPAIWYKTITKENGKPYLLAIVILADIVYWYRPSEVRDQGTGHILGWKKKFSEDILRQSYQYYADLFGESKKTVKTAMDKLEQLQVIRREFRIRCQNGRETPYKIGYPYGNFGREGYPKRDTGIYKMGYRS